MIYIEITNKLLRSLSWSNGYSQKKPITISNNNLIIKLLSAISFSEHKIKVVQKEDVLSPEVQANIEKLSLLWHTAQTSMAQGKFIISKNALHKIIEIDKYNAAAYNRLGILYATKKDYYNSIHNFKIAVSLEPSAAAMNNLGLINYQIENYRDALKYFKKASKLDSSAKRYIPIAMTYQKMGNDKLCLKYLDIASRKNPSIKLLKFIHSSYLHNNKLKEAKHIEALLNERSKKFRGDARIANKTQFNNGASLSSFMSYYTRL